jgi:hypothetical protein
MTGKLPDLDIFMDGLSKIRPDDINNILPSSPMEEQLTEEMLVPGRDAHEYAMRKKAFDEIPVDNLESVVKISRVRVAAWANPVELAELFKAAGLLNTHDPRVALVSYILAVELYKVEQVERRVPFFFNLFNFVISMPPENIARREVFSS